ncbi:MAG: adenylate/guanylate cyclase domain-containing protein, partial [Sandaracinaceae bacterium]|nr:adenylate/guanylate cyclase domain-containing protein [Sandaracinaceae bacterium]
MAVTRALLLTDVVDSTKLAETLGDEAMAALWSRHDALARDLLPRFGGREIDKTDGFLFLFERAQDAAAYAVAYHAALELPLRARAGLHVGPVILRENDAAHVARGAKPLEVEGLAKPIAARVMGLAGPGQTLVTAEARRALDDDAGLRVQSHGFWRMKGVAEPAEIFEVGDERAPFTPPSDGAKIYRVTLVDGSWRPAREVPHNLPRERDAFLGRQNDLQQMVGRIEGGAALISILGIGGTGKTRLVTRYGWNWLGEWPGGVWFCDLTEARDPAGICMAVARAIDVELREDGVTQLGQALAARGRCLVILDNFEQVAAHAADTLAPWLDRASAACFVVTSREVLGLSGEEVIALSPLDQGAAVDLFVARAASAKRGFELREVERADVVTLVELLDRLPLCIELAAARVRVMSPKVLVTRMGERFQLLASAGGREGRQATLRRTLDWSWDLLTPAERTALAQLSVFTGGFTMATAESVLDLSAHADAPWAPDLVQSLVDKSLAIARTDERFDLLVSVQAYAAEKLASMGLEAATEARHAEVFAAFGTSDALAALVGPEALARRRALLDEMDNLSNACRRATKAGRVDVALKALLGAREALQVAGAPGTILELAESILAQPDLTARDLALAASVAHRAALAAGQFPRAEEHGRSLVAAGEASRVSTEASAEPEVALLVASYRAVALRRSEPDEARRQGERAVALARTLGDVVSEASNLGSVALVDFEAGRYEVAEAGLLAVVERAVHTGQSELEYRARHALSMLCVSTARLERAREHEVTALARTREQGFRRGEGVALDTLATMDFWLGALARSCEGYVGAHAIVMASGAPHEAGRVRGNLGETQLAQGLLEDALTRFREAAGAAKLQGDPDLETHWNARAAEALWLLGDAVASRAQLEAAMVTASGAREGRQRVCARMWAVLEREEGALEAARAKLEALTAASAADDEPVF